MKKILVILCMVIMSIAIHAANKISLSSVVGQPTSEVQVDVSLENSDDIAAIEIKIPLDENMTYVDGSIEMNSARSNGHAISAGEVDKELRIYIYSFSLNSIVGNDGKLCSFKLKLKRLTLLHSYLNKILQVKIFYFANKVSVYNVVFVKSVYI